MIITGRRNLTCPKCGKPGQVIPPPCSSPDDGGVTLKSSGSGPHFGNGCLRLRNRMRRPHFSGRAENAHYRGLKSGRRTPLSGRAPIMGGDDIVPAGYQLVPAGTSWYQLIPAGTSWYQLVPSPSPLHKGALCKPCVSV